MTSSNRLKLKQLGSLRIHVVTEGGTDRAGRPIKAGSVVIFRRGRSYPDIYETVYDALRSRTEIICRYGLGEDGTEPGGELAQLDRTRERLRHTLIRLEAGQGSAGGSAARNISRVAGDLRCKSNPHKSQARSRAKAGPVRTAKNRRLNQAATQVRVKSMDGLLAAREEEVFRILPWIRAMEAALKLEVDRSFALVGRLVRDIAAVTSGHELFVRGRTTPNQIKGLPARLRLLRQGLDPLEAEPFRSFRELARAALDQAVAAVAAADARAAERHLEAVVAATDLVLLQRCVEALITSAAVTLVRGLDAGSVARLGRRAAETMDLAGDQDLSPAYRRVDAALKEAVGRLADCRRELSAGRRSEAVAAIKAFKEGLKDVSRRLSC